MENNRKIRKRLLFAGDLALLSPTHLSNGDDDPSVDLPLLTDPLEGRALLTGASLTGALRHYLNSFTDGYHQVTKDKKRVWEEKKNSDATRLFGGSRANDNGGQSRLILHDALDKAPTPAIELRDGVRIDPKSRTAEDQAKYDVQLLAAGTTFTISGELIITEKDDEADLKQLLAVALGGLQRGEIPLGGRKQRGYGECCAGNWRLWEYDLTTAAGLKGYLTHNRSWGGKTSPQKDKDDDIQKLLQVKTMPADRRQHGSIEATFGIDGSVLIRSGFESESGPDMSHLESSRPGASEKVPVMSGTSLAGVMRGQALRIANTLGGDPQRVEQFINTLFGYMPWRQGEVGSKQTSKVRVKESVIKGNYVKLVHTRVAIDRFTGGALESALFAEQPIYGGEFTLKLMVNRPTEAEMGLLLLVLKDLWTGFLPVGGESSVGRGRLQGRSATVNYGGKEWVFADAGNRKLTFTAGDPARLEALVAKFVEELR
ncbi:MAG: hypothetical protein KC418_18685 [Anaerolineales bacterium]|nr:hypothetical protein [Anaerolineales bacterium]